MEDNNILEIKDLYKSFGSTKANIGVNLTLRKGEVRGIIGENGSGKSTLLSQIAGIYPYDSGNMKLNGEVYSPKTPLEAGERGIGIVVQEFGVISALPAGLNIYLGRMGQFQNCGIVNIQKLYKTVRELSEKWGLPEIALEQQAGMMNVESRKIVEILRALTIDPEILILDEVTQALSLNNRRILYDIIKRYREMGRSVLLISHDLEETLEITDTITVMRDGEVVDTICSRQTNVNELKRMMVGRNIDGDFYRSDMEPSHKEEIILSVDQLSVGKEVSDVSFNVYAGEIVGLCGLSDSGIHTVGKALYGLEDDATGTVELKQTGIKIDSPQTALKSRIAYVPKERDGEGLMLNTSIMDNFCVPSLDDLLQKAGFISKKKRHNLADAAKHQYKVRCRDTDQNVSHLSGGNKQKINLGRWLAKDVGLMILDCPTRGVDVGVKAFIYDLIKKAKEEGIAIVLISDELTEALGMSDRLLVFKNGTIVKEISRGKDFTEETVIDVML